LCNAEIDGGVEVQYFGAKAPAIKEEEWLEKIEEGN